MTDQFGGSSHNHDDGVHGVPRKSPDAAPPPKAKRRAQFFARPTKPLTLGDLFGSTIRAARAAKARRDELDAAGFRAIEGAP